MYTKKDDFLFVVKISSVRNIYTCSFIHPSIVPNYPTVSGFAHFCSFRQRIIDIDRFADEISTYRISAAYDMFSV